MRSRAGRDTVVDRKRRSANTLDVRPIWAIDAGKGRYALMDDSGGFFRVTIPETYPRVIQYTGSISTGRGSKEVKGKITERVAPSWVEEVLLDVYLGVMGVYSRRPIPNKGARPSLNYYLDGLLGIQRQSEAWAYLRNQVGLGDEIEVETNKKYPDSLIFKMKTRKDGKFQSIVTFDLKKKVVTKVLNTWTPKGLEAKPKELVDLGGWFWNSYKSGDPMESNFFTICAVWSMLGSAGILENLPVIEDPAQSLESIKSVIGAGDLSNILFNPSKPVNKEPDFLQGVPSGAGMKWAKPVAKKVKAEDDPNYLMDPQGAYERAAKENAELGISE